MARSRHSQDWIDNRLFMVGMLATAQKQMSKAAVKTVVATARDFQNTAITGNSVPVYTGNLLDSTGIVVLESGRRVSTFYPDQIATKPQNCSSKRNIWGWQEWQEAAKTIQSLYKTGIVASLMSAVPYAPLVEAGIPPSSAVDTAAFEKNAGFFSSLVNKFQREMEFASVKGVKEWTAQVDVTKAKKK